MKRLIAAVICIVTVFSFTACSSSSRSDTSSSAASGQQSSADSTSESSSDSIGDISGVDVSRFKFNKGELVRLTDDKGEPLVPDLEIKGLILSSEHDGSLRYKDQIKDGFKTSGIFSDFSIGEYVNVYADTKIDEHIGDLHILCVPHQDPAVYVAKDEMELQSIINENGGFSFQASKPDEKQEKNFLGMALIVNNEEKDISGSYDLLFSYKGKVGYYVALDMKKAS